MFKLTSKRYGTYYCRTRAQADNLRADRRRLHGESGYSITEYTIDREQAKQDSLVSISGD